MECFRVKNGVKVYIMKQFRQLRPYNQYTLVIVKVAIKKDIEKLFILNNILFGESIIIILPFKKQRTPIVYYKCKRFRHKTKNCTQPNIYKIYK